MARISKLSDQLSNQIAAGEVVERPASVVKELVENAIDANSTQIDIEVKDGGLQFIRVRDNGDGIDNEDCQLAFQRHATSKIQNERDLFHIRTLGFRGEALPSIASVSKTVIQTCTGAGPGTYIEMEAGSLKEHALTSSRKGTDISVSQLFYNTPARLKYMKTVHTELGNISDVVNRAAMAKPNIAFSLTHNRKQLLKTSGNGDLLQVIAAVYGINVAKKMIPLQKQSLDFRVSGYLAKPELTRSSRQYISVFVNNRYIKHYPISQAIQEGYHTFLPIGRFPLAVVKIEMDPSLIDVNVHPAKLEARLSKEKELVQLIKEAIQASFRTSDLMPAATSPSPKANTFQQENLSFQFQSTPTRQGISSLFESHSNHSADVVYEKNEQTGAHANLEATNSEKASERRQIEDRQPAINKPRIPALYPLGQMHGTYLFAQNENGLYIIDQHAAQERIKYEYYREKVAEVEPKLQELLVPMTFEFNHREALLIEDHMETLKSLGVFLEPFGDKTYIVRSHPQWFPKGEEEETIKKIVENVLATSDVNIKKLREDTAIMMACKRSIKANHFLREDEVHALIDSLRACQDPFTCPHGRPVIVHFSTYDMEKMFKRVM